MPAARAFSLIELIVAIGVVLVLAGLLLPVLSRSMGTAKAVGQASALQQTMAVIEMYLRDWQDVYPLADMSSAVRSGHLFTQPLVGAGLIESPSNLGSGAFDAAGRTNITLSQCLVCDHQQMLPGRTVLESQRLASSVRAQDVSFPSDKGSIRMIRVLSDEANGTWCCIPGAPAAPVAFCDGSVGNYSWKDLLPPGEPLITENGVGFPVGTTWKGARGRDRQ